MTEKRVHMFVHDYFEQLALNQIKLLRTLKMLDENSICIHCRE